jgi:hypothetical protein
MFEKKEELPELKEVALAAKRDVLPVRAEFVAAVSFVGLRIPAKSHSTPKFHVCPPRDLVRQKKLD